MKQAKCSLLDIAKNICSSGLLYNYIKISKHMKENYKLKGDLILKSTGILCSMVHMSPKSLTFLSQFLPLAYPF